MSGSLGNAFDVLSTLLLVAAGGAASSSYLGTLSRLYKEKPQLLVFGTSAISWLFAALFWAISLSPDTQSLLLNAGSSSPNTISNADNIRYRAFLQTSFSGAAIPLLFGPLLLLSPIQSIRFRRSTVDRVIAYVESLSEPPTSIEPNIFSKALRISAFSFNWTILAALQVAAVYTLYDVLVSYLHMEFRVVLALIAGYALLVLFNLFSLFATLSSSASSSSSSSISSSLLKSNSDPLDHIRQKMPFLAFKLYTPFFVFLSVCACALSLGTSARTYLALIQSSSSSISLPIARAYVALEIITTLYLTYRLLHRCFYPPVLITISEDSSDAPSNSQSSSTIPQTVFLSAAVARLSDRVVLCHAHCPIAASTPPLIKPHLLQASTAESDLLKFAQAVQPKGMEGEAGEEHQFAESTSHYSGRVTRSIARSATSFSSSSNSNYFSPSAFFSAASKKQEWTIHQQNDDRLMFIVSTIGNGTTERFLVQEFLSQLSQHICSSYYQYSSKQSGHGFSKFHPSSWTEKMKPFLIDLMQTANAPNGARNFLLRAKAAKSKNKNEDEEGGKGAAEQATSESMTPAASAPAKKSLKGIVKRQIVVSNAANAFGVSKSSLSGELDAKLSEEDITSRVRDGRLSIHDLHVSEQQDKMDAANSQFKPKKNALHPWKIEEKKRKRTLIGVIVFSVAVFVVTFFPLASHCGGFLFPECGPQPV